MHPDSKYVIVTLTYAKEYAVLLSKQLIVPVGESGLPINTGVRGHRSQVALWGH